MKQKTAISKFSNGRLHLNMQESLTYVHTRQKLAIIKVKVFLNFLVEKIVKTNLRFLFKNLAIKYTMCI